MCAGNCVRSPMTMGVRSQLYQNNRISDSASQKSLGVPQCGPHARNSRPKSSPCNGNVRHKTRNILGREIPVKVQLTFERQSEIDEINENLSCFKCWSNLILPQPKVGLRNFLKIQFLEKTLLENTLWSGHVSSSLWSNCLRSADQRITSQKVQLM